MLLPVSPDLAGFVAVVRIRLRVHGEDCECSVPNGSVSLAVAAIRPLQVRDLCPAHRDLYSHVNEQHEPFA